VKIGLNANNLLCSNPAGPEWFTIRLYKELVNLETDEEFIFYFKKYPSTETINMLTQGKAKSTIKVLPALLSWTQLNLQVELVTNTPDVYFTPEHTIPMFSYLTTPIIAMIHGLEYQTNQELKKASLAYKRHEQITAWVCKHASKLIVPSEYVQSEVLKNFGNNIPPEKIKVIYEGLTENTFIDNKDEFRDLVNKYNITDKYILFVSTIQPRKNIVNTINAFSKALQENKLPANIKLILVGKNGWNYEQILDSVIQYHVENNVIFTGWLPQQDLMTLMAHATSFVNFSFDEGFSLTPLEAMSLQIPCALSSIPVHKEITNNIGVFANPNDIAEMKEAIIKTVQQPDTNTLLQAKERASQFTWKNTAQNFINVFHSLSPKTS
jgi:glycosyltransferase involved in cell wall biosynthesis